MKIVNIIAHNFWLKIIALIFAIATWFYVFDVVNPVSSPQKKEVLEKILERYNFTIKEVPVRPVFTGSVPEGYRVIYDKVKVVPSAVAIFGPEELVKKADELKTDKIDLSEYTRSMKLELGLHSDVKYLKFKDQTVSVYVPVEQIRKVEENE
ncbi:MAG: CdaR family protein [Candidatus Omnitrophota bacterium]